MHSSSYHLKKAPEMQIVFAAVSTSGPSVSMDRGLCGKRWDIQLKKASMKVLSSKWDVHSGN